MKRATLQKNVLVILIICVVWVEHHYSEKRAYEAGKKLNEEAIPLLVDDADFVFYERFGKENTLELDVEALTYLRKCFVDSELRASQVIYFKYDLDVKQQGMIYRFYIGYTTGEKRIAFSITKFQNDEVIVSGNVQKVSNCKFADFIQRFDIPVNYDYHERKIWRLEEHTNKKK